MPVVLDPELIKVPQRDEQEDRNAWKSRFTEAHNALRRHLAEVFPGKTYDKRDESPESMRWEAGALRFFVSEDKLYVPDFQRDEQGNLRATVGAVGIHLHTAPLPWGNSDVGLPLWWATIQPELDGCAPYELLGTSRNGELTKLTASIAARR